MPKYRLPRAIRRSHILSALLLFALGAPVALAQLRPEGEPKPAERLAALRPAYQALAADAKFAALSRELEAAPRDAASLDRLLRYMPLSPRDYLELDMQARRYEIPVPRVVEEQHARWIRLHEARARELYGSAYVNGVLADWPAATEDRQEGANKTTNLGSNENVATDGVPAPLEYQGEIQLAVNPNNVNQMVAAANTWDGMGGSCAGGILAIFNSTDGGATWGYNCGPGPAAYGGFPSCAGTVFGGDPAVYWNNSNEVFVNYMLMCYLGPGNVKYSMVVARSANAGATWNAQGVIKNSWSSGNLEDKNFYIVDNHPTSPYYGRHYTCWDRNNNEKVAYSTTNGASWTEVDLPAGAAGTLDLGCDMAVEDNGTLHLTFSTLDCGASCTNQRLFYTRSTNGAVTWSTPVLVRDFNLVAFSGANLPEAQDSRGIGPFGAIDVDNSGGACDGRLYATWSDHGPSETANDTDIWLAYSTNGGTSWTSPIKVNDDLVDGRIQFHPFLVVDPTNGHVVIAWHDARHASGNSSVQAYVARSTDCGASVEANHQVQRPSTAFNNWTWAFSNQNTSDNPNYNPNQFGEYLGLDARGGKAYVAWSDTRHFYPSSNTETEQENVGFAVVDFTTGPTKANFKSQWDLDGFVTESGENTNVGGGVFADGFSQTGISIGDTLGDTQMKGFVSFDTAAIPDGATVQTAKLRLRRGTVVGSNPFTLFGAPTVDIRTGGFSGNTALQASDFQAAATASAVCTLSSPAADRAWAECTLSTAGKAAINKTGVTQLRIAFGTDDNDDAGSDYMGFYAGNPFAPYDQPLLEVTYE